MAIPEPGLNGSARPRCLTGDAGRGWVGRTMKALVRSQVLSRRELLGRLPLATLLSLGCWPGARSVRAMGGEGAFRFLVANDLHHLNAQCDPWFEALVEQMKGHAGVAFVLLLGDLAETGERQNLEAIRDHFARLELPVYVEIGNHDYRSSADREAYEALYPGRLNYNFVHAGWQFVGIDSTQGTDWQDTTVQPTTLRWLDQTLPTLDRALPTVVFTHFPLASEVQLAPRNAEDVLRRFLGFNLRGVFSGHWHGLTEQRFQRADVVTNVCCARSRGNHDGSARKGYWLVRAEDGDLRRRFIEFKGAPDDPQ